MAKRNRKLRNEVIEQDILERNLFLIKGKNDNISKRMDGLFLRDVLPKTQAQSDTFDAYNEKFNLMLHGCAGTGKTFITFHSALKEVLDPKSPFN